MKVNVAALMVCGLGYIFSPMQAALAGDDGESCQADGKRPDYSAANAAGGIDLYVTTLNGVKLATGSPFVPDPVPEYLGAPYPSPYKLILDAKHEYEYAFYIVGESPTELLWSFKLTPNGLKQEDSLSLDYGYYGPKETLVVYLAGATEHLVYVLDAGGYVNFRGSLTLYKVDKGHFTGSSSILDLGRITESGTETKTAPASMHIDGAEHFLYACFPNGVEPTDPLLPLFPPSVAVYHLKDGVATFVVNSTNPEYIASNCP